MTFPNSMANSLANSLSNSIAGAGRTLFAKVADQLGGLLVEGWDSELGVVLGTGNNIATWTGQKLGYVLTPQNNAAPATVVADGTNFNSRKIVRQAVGIYPTQGTVTQLVAASTPIYVLSVNRQRTTGNPQRIWELGNKAAPESEIYLTTSSTTKYMFGALSAAGTASTNSAVSYDQAAHMTELWLDSALVNLSVDGGAATTQACVLGAHLGITHVSLGAISVTGGPAQVGDSSHRLFMVCSGLPSAGVRATIRTIIQADSGTP